MNEARGKGGKGPFYAALVAILVAGAGLIWYMSRQGTTATAITIDPKDAVGQTAEGYVLGRATAPVEIVEYADFECPGCGQFATVTEPDIRSRLVQTGQARFRLFDFQVNGTHRNSTWERTEWTPEGAEWGETPEEDEREGPGTGPTS